MAQVVVMTIILTVVVMEDQLPYVTMDYEPYTFFLIEHSHKHMHKILCAGVSKMYSP